jgi:hypothetical protein
MLIALSRKQVLSYETENGESVVSKDLSPFMSVSRIHEESAVVPNVRDYSPNDTRHSVKKKVFSIPL